MKEKFFIFMFVLLERKTKTHVFHTNNLEDIWELHFYERVRPGDVNIYLCIWRNKYARIERISEKYSFYIQE